MGANSSEIQKYLRASYGIEAGGIIRAQGGVANWNYLVKSNRGSYLFKIYRYRTPAQIDFETKTLNYLSRKNFNSPKVILNLEGRLFGIMDKKPCVLFGYIEGFPLKSITPGIMLKLGKQVASLHMLLRNRREGVKRENWDYEAVKLLLKKHKAGILRKMYPMKREIISFLEKELAGIHLPSNMPKGLTHQDIKPENIILARDGNFHFIDFDNMYRGGLAIDMATTLIWAGFKNGFIYLPYFNAFMKGYESQRKLTRVEKKNFETILKFRLLREAFIWIWLYSDKNAQRLCSHFLSLYRNLP